MPPKRCAEFILQCAAMVASGGALVGAIFIQMKYTNLSNNQRTNIDLISRREDINEIYVKTQATAGIVFASTGVAVLVGLAALIGRIINSRNDGRNRRLFSCLYMLYLLACFIFFATAGVLGAFTAIDWSTIFGSNLLIFENDLENLRNSVAATSACSLLTSLLYAVLELVILFCCSANKEY